MLCQASAIASVDVTRAFELQRPLDTHAGQHAVQRATHVRRERSSSPIRDAVHEHSPRINCKSIIHKFATNAQLARALVPNQQQKEVHWSSMQHCGHKYLIEWSACRESDMCARTRQRHTLYASVNQTMCKIRETLHNCQPMRPKCKFNFLQKHRASPVPARQGPLQWLERVAAQASQLRGASSQSASRRVRSSAPSTLSQHWPPSSKPCE
jgi:hypothetical protein